VSAETVPGSGTVSAPIVCRSPGISAHFASYVPKPTHLLVEGTCFTPGGAVKVEITTSGWYAYSPTNVYLTAGSSDGQIDTAFNMFLDVSLSMPLPLSGIYYTVSATDFATGTVVKYTGS
jgi:hypothetical protein